MINADLFVPYHSSAGSAYHETRLWARFGNQEEAELNWQEFRKQWLNR